MLFIERIFPKQDVRKALQMVSEIEQSLPNALGPSLGFDVIKSALRWRIRARPEELRAAIRTTGYPINVLVVILARNVVWDALESGQYSLGILGAGGRMRMTMAGDGLIALHSHLTDLIENAGAETKEEAAASRQNLREAVGFPFGR
ncbi:MAG: hypothetical protein WBB34_21720 [Xanthobacteraceae bacterium]